MREIIGIIFGVLAIGGLLTVISLMVYDVLYHRFCKKYDFNKPFDNLIPPPPMKPPKKPESS